VGGTAQELLKASVGNIPAIADADILELLADKANGKKGCRKERKNIKG